MMIQNASYTSVIKQNGLQRSRYIKFTHIQNQKIFNAANIRNNFQKPTLSTLIYLHLTNLGYFVWRWRDMARTFFRQTTVQQERTIREN